MSNLYNMLNGVNPSTFLILPVLGRHPEEYPRFRDCFFGTAHKNTENKIVILTRTAASINTEDDEVNAILRETKGFLFHYIDENDDTYAHWVFDVPEEWVDDINKVVEGKLKETSKDYQSLVIKTFPKIEDKIKEIFD